MFYLVKLEAKPSINRSLCQMWPLGGANNSYNSPIFIVHKYVCKILINTVIATVYIVTKVCLGYLLPVMISETF